MVILIKKPTYLIIFLFSLITQIYSADYKNININFSGMAGSSWGSTKLDSKAQSSLNLKGMNQIGGYLENSDSAELAFLFKIKPEINKNDAFWSTFLTFGMNNQAGDSRQQQFISSDATDNYSLRWGILDCYIEAGNLDVKNLKIWVGARRLRGPRIKIADYRYFNELYGQGFGLAYKNSSLDFMMRSGLTDERRVITAISFNQKWQISKSNMLHFLGQYYILPEFKDIPTSTDLPKDEGQVFGIRHLYKKSDDNFNDFSVRTGAGLANGGDNGLAIPWITYGTKALDGTYKTAESLSIVEHFLFDLKKNKSALNGYAIYNINKGATSVYSDSKNDFTVGTRFGYFLTDHFHLIMDNTYQVRRSSDLKDGEVFRLGIIPTISLNGERNLMAKNVIRFIFGYAKYNNEAVKNYLSRSTSITGNYDYFIGIKTEWDF